MKYLESGGFQNQPLMRLALGLALLLLAGFWVTNLALYFVAFGSALLSEAAGWMTRFWHPAFAWLKVTMFVLFQASLGMLIIGLAVFLASAEALRRRIRTERHRGAAKVG